MYWDVNNLYECAISSKLIANSFKWVKNTFQSNEHIN